MLEILNAFLIILSRMVYHFYGDLVYSMINYFIEMFRELFLAKWNFFFFEQIKFVRDEGILRAYGFFFFFVRILKQWIRGVFI